MIILIISQGYPYRESNEYVFVKQLVDEFVKLDQKVIVISPQSMTKIVLKKTKKRPYKNNNYSNHQDYIVYTPKYISFSNFYILKRLNHLFYQWSILRVIRKENLSFDFSYAHFIKGPGTTAYKIHKKFGIPFFIATGESTFNFEKNKKIIQTINSASGIIALSKEINNRLLKLDPSLNLSKVLVEPNGFNDELFYKIDNRFELRKKYSLTENDIVVSFVGSFIERKGIIRLDKALIDLDYDKLYSIYIGSGPQKPSYVRTIYQGKVRHSNINEFLNISDIFVLPTLNEGSSNAIIEAMAVGLPIISSNMEFNDEILFDNAIRVDTNSIDEIKHAIKLLVFDKSLRDKMAESSIKLSKKFLIEKRANRILNFLISKI